jgi:hypothetical protein
MTAKSTTRAKSSSNGSDLGRPAPFVFLDRREWIDCPIEGWTNFAIYVRTDITVREYNELRRQYEANRRYEREWLTLDEGDDAEWPIMRDRKLMAPYILAWNLMADPGDGKALESVPSPSEAGHEVFDYLTPDVLQWAFRVVLIGYYLSGKARPLESASAPTGDTPEPSSPDTPDPEPSP